MSDIWKVIVFVIGSVGGVGTLIIGASTLIGRMLVERYAAKTELKINQELEKVKSELEENRSISEALFKKSFEVYGALVEKCQYMISDAYSLFSKHISTEEMQEICKKEDKTSLHKSLKKSQNSRYDFLTCLYQRAIFISEEEFESFNSLQLRALHQQESFRSIYLENDANGSIAELYARAWSGSISLAVEYENYIKKLRKNIYSRTGNDRRP